MLYYEQVKFRVRRLHLIERTLKRTVTQIMVFVCIMLGSFYIISTVLDTLRSLARSGDALPGQVRFIGMLVWALFIYRTYVHSWPYV